MALTSVFLGADNLAPVKHDFPTTLQESILRWGCPGYGSKCFPLERPFGLGTPTSPPRRTSCASEE